MRLRVDSGPLRICHNSQQSNLAIRPYEQQPPVNLDLRIRLARQAQAAVYSAICLPPDTELQRPAEPLQDYGEVA
jgi:hypothetical protein